MPYCEAPCGKKMQMLTEDNSCLSCVCGADEGLSVVVLGVLGLWQQRVRGLLLMLRSQKLRLSCLSLE